MPLVLPRALFPDAGQARGKPVRKHTREPSRVAAFLADLDVFYPSAASQPFIRYRGGNRQLQERIAEREAEVEGLKSKPLVIN